MEFKVIDFENFTEQQILGTIHGNVKRAKIISDKLAQLKMVASSSAQPSTQETPKKNIENQNGRPKDYQQNEEDLYFEIEIAYYYSKIKNKSPDQINDHITELLPPRDNPQYELILYRLQAEILKGIKDIKEFIATEQLSEAYTSELKEEILNEQEKIRIIGKKLISREETIITEESSKPALNNLIFVPTTSGNIRVLEELDKISPEYYARFFELFQSIKNGTFKNDQRQRGDSNLAGLRIVRHFNIRVAYTRLDENNYAVLTAFIKKADRDKAITSSLASKYMDYKAIEERLIANLDNEEFIKLNEQYETQMFEMLSPKVTKEVQMAKRKEGDK